MKLTYIYHSCFALETPAYSILFDYYKDTKGKQGYVHDILLQKPEPLYILSSHFHPDHFSREIFFWKEQKENIHYLLSKDILKHKKAMASEATFLAKGDIYEDAPDSGFRLDRCRRILSFDMRTQAYLPCRRPQQLALER